MGAPKQLIKFNDDFLINHMIRTIRTAGIEELVVVLGSAFDLVRDAVVDPEVRIVNNPDWQEGISSSLKKGLDEISHTVDVLINFVVDQPFLTPEILQSFISYFVKYDPDILVTRVRDQLVHPVLFKRRFFDDLRSLQGDKGGKQLFSRNEIDYFDSEDERLLIDIDNEDDLKRFKKASN